MCDIPLTNTEELDTAVWEHVIRDGAKLGATTTVFSGGEPLLRDDLTALIAFAKKQKMLTCVTTNGLLLDEKRAYELLCAGVDVVNVSIEGPRDAHDALRGKGSFDRALAALKNLRKYSIEATIATVVTTENFKHLPYLVELAKQNGVTAFKLQPFNPMFLDKGKQEKNFYLSEQDAPLFEQTIFNVIETCCEYGIGTNPEKYLYEMFHPLTGRQGTSPKKCPALELSCPINAKGEVYPCWVLNGPTYLLGSVKDQSLKDIWNSSRRMEIIASINKQGCPGCLMSCYEENLGKASVGQKILTRLGLLRRKGLAGYISSSINRWKKRIKFYSSWRGDASSALRRVKGKLGRGARSGKPIKWDPKELSAVLEDLNRMKRLLAEESRRASK
jgi:radical SAM protein with 4Fe4S-binding SPASM domain